MRLYTNLSGVVTGYAWTTSATSPMPDPATHLPIFAHIPIVTVARPTNLTATATTAGPVTLKWVDHSGIEDGYRVERKLFTGTAWTTIATLGRNVTAYVDRTAAAATRYSYRVSGHVPPVRLHRVGHRDGHDEVRPVGPNRVDLLLYPDHRHDRVGANRRVMRRAPLTLIAAALMILGPPGRRSSQP